MIRNIAAAAVAALLQTVACQELHLAELFAPTTCPEGVESCTDNKGCPKRLSCIPLDPMADSSSGGGCCGLNVGDICFSRNNFDYSKRCPRASTCQIRGKRGRCRYGRCGKSGECNTHEDCLAGGVCNFDTKCCVRECLKQEDCEKGFQCRQVSSGPEACDTRRTCVALKGIEEGCGQSLPCKRNLCREELTCSGTTQLDMTCRERLPCKTTCGHPVPHGWYGPGTGSMHCREVCWCEDGHFQCDEGVRCPPTPRPSCLSSGDICYRGASGSDRSTECPPFHVCAFKPGVGVVAGAEVKHCLRTCSDDTDCEDDAWCRVLPDPTKADGCLPDKVCVKRNPEGGVCGSTGPGACREEQCQQGVSCADGVCGAPQDCTTECGTTFPHGWKGPGEGVNTCTTCECNDGKMQCVGSPCEASCAKRCTPGGRGGEGCPGDSWCRPLLGGDESCSTTHVCSTLRSLGESCASGPLCRQQRCEDGLECDGNVCAVPAPCDVGCGLPQIAHGYTGPGYGKDAFCKTCSCSFGIWECEGETCTGDNRECLALEEPCNARHHECPVGTHCYNEVCSCDDDADCPEGKYCKMHLLRDENKCAPYGRCLPEVQKGEMCDRTGKSVSSLPCDDEVTQCAAPNHCRYANPHIPARCEFETECILNCGNKVPHGWTGKQEGATYHCRDCSCDHGELKCNDVTCERWPGEECMGSQSVCLDSENGIDRGHECPSEHPCTEYFPGYGQCHYECKVHYDCYPGEVCLPLAENDGTCNEEAPTKRWCALSSWMECTPDLAKCDRDYKECEVGLVCVESKCVRPVRKGESCVGKEQQCIYGTGCHDFGNGTKTCLCSSDEGCNLNQWCKPIMLGDGSCAATGHCVARQVHRGGCNSKYPEHPEEQWACQPGQHKCLLDYICTEIGDPDHGTCTWEDDCMLDCGTMVPHKWEGFNEGELYCHRCKCVHGGLQCENNEEKCARRPGRPCLEKDDLCKFESIDRSSECPPEHPCTSYSSNPLDAACKGDCQTDADCPSHKWCKAAASLDGSCDESLKRCVEYSADWDDPCDETSPETPTCKSGYARCSEPYKCSSETKKCIATCDFGCGEVRDAGWAGTPPATSKYHCRPSCSCGVYGWIECEGGNGYCDDDPAPCVQH